MTNPWKLEDAIDALCAVARPIILRSARPDSCIASARVGMDVLKRLGIRSHALAVKVAIFNEKGHEFMVKNRPDLVREKADGAYSVGIGHGAGPDPAKWDGHLVLIVDERYLVDLSIDQAERPQYKLFIRPFYARIEPDFGTSGSQMLLSNPVGGSIHYQPMPENEEWKNAPDWNRARWLSVTREVAAAVRERLVKVKP